MSPASLDAIVTVLGFPRVSGDEPGPRAEDAAAQPFSPRERG